MNRMAPLTEFNVSEIQQTTNALLWSIIDGVLLMLIICGNTLTILAVRYTRRLRHVISNLFILSLAISDMFVGFTLPYHLAFYLNTDLDNSSRLCLLRFFLIVFACCVSIWSLISIAIDRYIAIIHPLQYNRVMTKKKALIIIGIGWILATIIATVPMFWNNRSTAVHCEFNEILTPWYLGGILTPIFSLIWICMLFLYWRIWREAAKQSKQLRSSTVGLQSNTPNWKSIQIVLLVLGSFSVCWLPYVVIACVQIFRLLGESSTTLYKGAFSLAMANSGMNPLIYAWKSANYRQAFGRLLACRSPDSNSDDKKRKIWFNCLGTCNYVNRIMLKPAISMPMIHRKLETISSRINEIPVDRSFNMNGTIKRSRTL